MHLRDVIKCNLSPETIKCGFQIHDAKKLILANLSVLFAVVTAMKINNLDCH